MDLHRATEAAAHQRASAPHDAEEIVARLAAAGETLAALPGTGCRPRGLHTMWPAFLADPASLSVDLECDRPIPPPAAAITAMDEALGWVRLLDDDLVRERRIVLRRALGWSWARIGAEVGMSHEGARKAHAWAIRQIAVALAYASKGKRP